MKIEFTDGQLGLLKEIIAEYAEDCYQGMFELKRMAMDASDAPVVREYEKMAEAEEARFLEAKELGDYIGKYEELFGKG